MNDVVQTNEQLVKIANLAVETVLYAMENDEGNILKKIDMDVTIPMLIDIATNRIRDNIKG
jgi:hypothetical protein|nr:MAG TPA: hypothetical protein [Caudoviricetes sp.]DAQ18574.1 MAG TPA: hypothetical protein [Caudoviricetes sp.]